MTKIVRESITQISTEETVSSKSGYPKKNPLCRLSFPQEFG